MNTCSQSVPTLLDLVDAVLEAAGSSREAAAVVNHLFESGRVRFLDPCALRICASASGAL
ncbi:MAG: hypothetical protein ACHQ6V_01910 [Myxococcota bacterium]|jgi:hypothetical protein